MTIIVISINCSNKWKHLLSQWLYFRIQKSSFVSNIACLSSIILFNWLKKRRVPKHSDYTKLYLAPSFQLSSSRVLMTLNRRDKLNRLVCWNKSKWLKMISINIEANIQQSSTFTIAMTVKRMDKKSREQIMSIRLTSFPLTLQVASPSLENRLFGYGI